MGRSLLGVGACILLNACGATPGGGDGRGAPGYQGARWPDYVVSPGTQYRGPRGRKKVAFVSDGVRLVPQRPQRWRTGTPDLVSLHVEGPLELWLTGEPKDLSVLVCRPGELPGTELYAGVGDPVALTGPLQGTQVAVLAKVTLPDRTIERTSTLPVSALCTQRPADPPSPGQDTCPIHTMPLAVLSQPRVGNGSLPLTTLPPRWDTCVLRLETKDGYARILVGEGPYLAGWIPAAAAGEATFGVVDVLASMELHQVPLELRMREGLPLYGLAAGADVFSDGVRVAKVHAAGFARLLSKEVRNDQAYVLAAVNNDAWVEGWVFASTLTVLPKESKEDPAARDRK